MSAEFVRLHNRNFNSCDKNGDVSGNSAIQNRGFVNVVAGVLCREPTRASSFCIPLTIQTFTYGPVCADPTWRFVRVSSAFRPRACWEDVQCVLGGYILPVNHTIRRSPHSTSTKWADRRASSLLNSSQTFRAVPTVSSPDGSPSIVLTALQLRIGSFSDSKGTPRDPYRSPHRSCTAATKTSSRAVPPADAN
jgi:hypothetical protein